MNDDRSTVIRKGKKYIDLHECPDSIKTTTKQKKKSLFTILKTQ